MMDQEAEYPQLDGPQPLEAVLYLRYSDKNQTDLSLSAQKRACLLALQREGYQGSIAFADAARTGTKDRRPGFQAAIKYAMETPGIKVFCVYDTSRFARNRQDALTYKFDLRQAKIKILYATQPITDDPDGEILEGVLELFDARFSKVLSRVTLRGMLEKGLRGEAPGGRAPFGYRKVQDDEQREAAGRYNLDAIEGEAVKLMFQAALTGIGKRTIVSMLENKGFRTRAGKPFSPSVVDATLRNPAYKGTYIFNRRGKGLMHQGPKDPKDWIVIPGYYPAIVSEEEWQRIQDQRAELRPHTPAGKTPRSRHLLVGLMVHETCNTRMVVERAQGSSGSQYLYYVCAGRKSRPDGTCKGLRVRADRVEGPILEFILSKVLSDENVRGFIKRLEKLRSKLVKENETDRRKLTLEYDRIRLKIDAVLDAQAEGLIDKATLKQRIDPLQHKRDQIQARLDSLPQVADVRHLQVPERTVKFYQEGLREILKRKDPKEVRNFLARFVDEIRIGDERVDVIGRYYKPGQPQRDASSSFGLAWLPGQDSNLQPSG